MESVLSRKTTRSILVIEEEYQFRVSLLQALSAENWNVVFAITEATIKDAVKNVAGVILSWNASSLLNRDLVLKMVGDLPLLIAEKPYNVSQVVSEVQSRIGKDQFFVGDIVFSKITPDWGEGRIVSIYPDQFYGVIFRSDQQQNGAEIALRCHFTGLQSFKNT